jgi:hypothetical protein
MSYRVTVLELEPTATCRSSMAAARSVKRVWQGITTTPVCPDAVSYSVKVLELEQTAT